MTNFSGEMLNAMWQDLKDAGAIGIHDHDGVLRVHMSEMDNENCLVKPHSEKWDQVYKVAGGVEFFSLIKKDGADSESL